VASGDSPGIYTVDWFAQLSSCGKKRNGIRHALQSTGTRLGSVTEIYNIDAENIPERFFYSVHVAENQQQLLTQKYPSEQKDGLIDGYSFRLLTTGDTTRDARHRDQQTAIGSQPNTVEKRFTYIYILVLKLLFDHLSYLKYLSKCLLPIIRYLSFFSKKIQ
jgi:hypothetical protein